MTRATHLNPADFSQAPRAQGGRNPFLGVLGAVVRQVESGSIDRQTERDVIGAAAYYAKRNRLPFTPTLHGVVQMAAHADRMHREHMAALDSRNRLEYKPEISGFDRVSGFEI